MYIWMSSGTLAKQKLSKAAMMCIQNRICVPLPHRPPINSGLYALTPPAFISSLNAMVAY
jgi:hypothetical protein